MLEKLRIRGFQIHQDTTIEFDPKVTCIIGKNGSGKSCAMRAMRWLALNEPEGKRFINWDSDHAEVTLWADGKRLSRKIGGGNNCYILEGKRFDALGRSKEGKVPAEVTAFLRMGESSFQLQNELPYWVYQTAGEVARALNRVVNLEVMDASLARADAEIRKARAEVKVTETRLAEARKRRDDLAWVQEADDELKALEALEEERAGLEQEAGALGKLLEENAGLERERQELVEWLPKLRRLAKWADEAEVLGKEAKILDCLLAEHALNAIKAENAKSEIKKLRERLDKEAGGICPACGQEMPT